MLPWDPTGKTGPKKPLPDHVSIVEPKEEIVPTTPVSEHKGGKPEQPAAPVMWGMNTCQSFLWNPGCRPTCQMGSNLRVGFLGRCSAALHTGNQRRSTKKGSLHGCLGILNVRLCPNFRRKVLISGYLIIHDITILGPFPVQRKSKWWIAENVFFVRTAIICQIIWNLPWNWSLKQWKAASANFTPIFCLFWTWLLVRVDWLKSDSW